MTNLPSNRIKLGTWTFNEIKLEDMNMYSEYIKATQYPANLWSSNFAYLWASGQSKMKKVLWKVVDGMLVTFGYSKYNSLYLMCLPFGEGTPEKLADVLLKCLKYCYQWNHNDASKSMVKIINSMQLEYLREAPSFEKLFTRIPLVGIEKHFSISKLISLDGSPFKEVRKKIRKFHQLYPDVIIRKYTPKDYDQVMQLGKHWRETSGQKYATIFDTVYFREIIKHSDELNHLVFVVETGDKIIGMVSGGELPTGQSWGCLSKFRNEFEGLSTFLIVEFAREIHKFNPTIEYLNTGSDLGPGGLRFFKDRFRPVLNLKRYRIKLKMN